MRRTALSTSSRTSPKSVRRGPEKSTTKPGSKRELLQPTLNGSKKAHKPNELAGSIDEFLAIISHELRIPMSAILGWIELLDNEQVDQTGIAHAVEVIRRNALVQAKLIEELADYSRLGANKLSLTIRRVSLAQILNAALETLVPTARKKQLNVDVQLCPSEAEIDGDYIRLQQVFLNLFSNAIKFTPYGGAIKVSMESSSDRHTITVSDTGEGISADFLPFVFDRYRQADPTATRHGGLGLGLTIARHIVELHGGTIRAESGGEGEGAEFIVDLPCSGRFLCADTPSPIEIPD